MERKVIGAASRVQAMSETEPVNHRTFAGYGDGRRCAICGDFVDRSQVQYDVELQRPGRGRTLPMHLACYNRWRRSTGTTG